MLSIRTPRIAYDYPADFPQSARANVFDAEMRAGQVLDEKKSSIRYQADADALLLEFVLPVFATFAEAACNLGMQGTYSRKSVESECYKFLQHLAIEARLTSRGEIRDDVQSNLERSDEWEKYRQLLRRVADSQVGGAPAKGSKPVAKAARAADVKKARAETVGKLIKELDNIKPQMLEDDKEYRRLRTQYPDYLSFKIAEKRPDLKAKILAIRGSARHIRLAQELAAAHYGRELSTIEHDWKDHKPSAFKRRK
jgi:hypothetical protein